MPTEDWAFYKSPRFYLVLFLGFFTCLGWSIILHAIKGEYLKEDTDLVFRTKLLQLREQEDELNKQVDQLKQEVITIESTAKQLQATIDLKTKQLNNIVYSVTNLEKRITAFYDGWITYVANLRNNAGLIASSESVFGEFKAQYLSRKESSITQLTNS
jgi:cell division protein FtsB